MPLKKVEPSDGAGIELSEIQGDILIGLQKNVEAFLLFNIDDVQGFKVALRSQLGKITFSDEISDREKILIKIKKAGGVKPNFVAANILFGHDGLNKLAALDGAQLEPAFLRNASERGALLKDNPAFRLSQFDDNADAILLITAADEATLAQEVAGWRGVPFVSETYFEIGRVRPGNEKGHEHFGFLDGVSQPGVKGLTTPGQHAPTSPPGDQDQGLPGQDLIEVGAFVLGYTNQDGSPAEPPLPWMRNGSYMVLRRLEQEVLKFRSFLEAAAPANEVTADHFGARLVGRWKSGAPIMIATGADDPSLGDNIFKNNDFDFNDDNHQVKCPFLGHIRKSYPRDDLDFTSGFPDENDSYPNKGDGEEFAEKHRIIRAGIPFGFEIGQDPSHGPHEEIEHEASRGLMFVSYQSSIENGFEFIQTKYCNNSAFPPRKSAEDGSSIIAPGIDLIIGQTDDGRRFGDMSSMGVSSVISDVPLFVKPTGTTYFFSPSRAALRDVLTA